MTKPISKKLKTADAVAADVKAIQGEFDHVVSDKPLWLEIVRFLDRDMLVDVIDDIPELKGMGLLVRAERRTKLLLEEIRQGKAKLESGDPNSMYQALENGLCLLEFESANENDFLYQWSAAEAGFKSKETFAEFCKHAGINPLKGYKYLRYHYLSDDKKVIFTCSTNPARSDSDEAYAHFVVMTGSRDRVKWLYSWFHDHCSWGTMWSGERVFI